MGLFQGSHNISRYKIYGFKKNISLNRLSDLIAPHKAKSLKLQGIIKEELIGWVCPHELNRDLNEPDLWDISECRLEEGFYLRFRVERRKVPIALQQLVIRERLGKKEQKRTKPLSKKEKKDFVEGIKQELLALMLPALKYIDVYWNDKTADLWLFSSSTTVRKQFEKLFGQTFCQPLNLKLLPIDPPLLGLSNEDLTPEIEHTPTLDKLTITVPTTYTES